MKQSTKNTIIKMHELTKNYCGSCNMCQGEKYRCCDKVFCDIVDHGLQKMGIKISKVNSEVPFMGESGCIVPPEYRPFCSGYICPDILHNDRDFRRKWTKLDREMKLKIRNDDEASKLIQ